MHRSGYLGLTERCPLRRRRSRPGGSRRALPHTSPPPGETRGANLHGIFYFSAALLPPSPACPREVGYVPARRGGVRAATRSRTGGLRSKRALQGGFITYKHRIYGTRTRRTPGSAQASRRYPQRRGLGRRGTSRLDGPPLPQRRRCTLHRAARGSTTAGG